MFERLKSALPRLFPKAKPVEADGLAGNSVKIQDYVSLFSTAAIIATNWIQRSVGGLEFSIVDENDNPLETLDSMEVLGILKRKRGQFLQTSIRDRILNGNAYYIIEPEGLTYILPHYTKPLDSLEGKDYLSTELKGIEINTPGNAGVGRKVLEEDLLHIRHGINPEYPCLGISQLSGVFDDISADCESSETSAIILKNLARLGPLITPTGDDTFDAEEVETVTDAIRNQLAKGDKGGELIFGRELKIQYPDNLTLKGIAMEEVRRYAETRICASLGIQPSVVGFSGGITNSRVGAVQSSMVKTTWEDGIIPMLNDISDQAGDTLLPKYGIDNNRYRLHIDTSSARARYETPVERATRLAIYVKNGIIEPAVAEEELRSVGDLKDE